MAEYGTSVRTEIVPSRGWQGIDAHELWRFRELVYFMMWRDVKVRYKQTLLGAGWAVLQPALMMVVFTVFLGVMAKVPGANDPIFVYAGILPWTFFATAMANAGNSLITSERLITKIYFPRLAVPLGAVGAAVVDFLVASVLLVGMMLWRGVRPGMSLIMVPIVVVVIGLAAIGMGTLLAALTVAYRDFRYVIPFLTQFWLFATPTAYSALPVGASPWVQGLVMANPLSGLIAAFRAGLFGEHMPWGLLASATALVMVILAGGLLYFRHVEDSLADIV